ncbi:hypothetical protein [uncultured Sneathiella sp.]|uniref:hypothetical protein n=1 Tax=uncultured Sneathiella sp. TaxID=879315 RepID=UPI0030EC8D59
MKNVIHTEAHNELLSKSYFSRLAVATANLGISRREIPNWITDTIYGFDGKILWPHGQEFIVSDTAIDDAFNNDGSFRWLSDFIASADREPRRNPQARLLDRLRLIDLAFRISKP